MNKKFTFLTLTFNAEKTIQKTISSLNKIKDDDVELIVIDGGSSDKTPQILQNCGVFTKIISEPDLNLAHALNKGILRSTGDVIGVIMSGTVLFEASLVAARKHYAIDRNKNSILAGSAKFDSQFSEDRIRSRMLELSSKNTEILHETIYIPRTVYEMVGLYDIGYQLSSDFDWISRAFQQEVEIFYSDDLFVDYGKGWGKTGLPKNLNRKLWEHFHVMQRDIGLWFAIKRLSKRHTYNILKNTKLYGLYKIVRKQQK